MKLGNEYNKTLHIRISEEQYKEILSKAKSEGLTISEYCRKILS